jgi:hypothetical protein
MGKAECSGGDCDGGGPNAAGATAMGEGRMQRGRLRWGPNVVGKVDFVLTDYACFSPDFFLILFFDLSSVRDDFILSNITYTHTQVNYLSIMILF